MVATTDDVTKLREHIDRSFCVNNSRKYSETKKKKVCGFRLACLLRGTATMFDVIAMP